VRTLIILDPLEDLELAGDTSYALMLEIASRGHELWTCQPGHLSLEHDDVIAAAQQTECIEADEPAAAFRVAERTAIPLEAFDCVMMRKDPPVDEIYLQTCWLLDYARHKTLVVNDPVGLRSMNEHLSVLRFPNLTPPTIVTRDRRRVRAFLDEQGGRVVVKPVEGFGGRGIYLLSPGDPNLSSLLDTATEEGRSWTVCQRYLPEAVEGDKRVLLLEGEPLGAVLRVPPANEARGNLHVGGRAQKAEITAQDRAIIKAVNPVLAENGLHFVGLDIIGGRLTELNFTSPTGIRHIDVLDNTNLSARVIDWVEQKTR